MRSTLNGRRAATVFAALAFVLAPTAGYAADDVPSGMAATAEPDGSAGQTDDVDTSSDEPSGLVAASRTYCSHDGYTATGDPRQRCTKLDNGYLFHWKNTVDTGTRAYTSYDKTGGGSVSVRLGYSYNGTEHWSSYSSIGSGNSKSKSWGFGERNRDCKSTIGLLQQRGKDKVQTPIAKC
jgi:putative hemolysin